ncbi:MAG TPA: hypothetical protein VF212_11905, partial [Longimicrobiales bacterium]
MPDTAAATRQALRSELPPDRAPAPADAPAFGPEETPLPDRSPALTPSDLAARLTGAPPATLGAAPAIVSQVQTAYGNAYAVQLVAQLRARGRAAGAQAGSPVGAAGAAAGTEVAAPEPQTGTPAVPEAEAPPPPRATPEPVAAIAAAVETAPTLASIAAPTPAATPAPTVEPAVAPAAPPAGGAAAPRVEPDAASAAEAAPEPASAPGPPAPPPPPPPPGAEPIAEPAGAAAAPAAAPPAPEPASATPPEMTGEAPEGGAVEMGAAPAAGGGAVDAGAAAPPEAAPADETATEEGAAPAEGGAAPAAERAPASPEEDPAFQAVLERARAVARSQGHNSPAQRKAAEAQAAAPGPPTEVEDAAAGRQVGRMAEQEPAPFDKEAFKRALMERVAAIAPRSLEEADEFKESNKTASLKDDVAGEVTESKEATQAPVEETTNATPDTSGVEPKPVEPLPPTPPGPPPPDIGAEAAAPKPKTEAEVSLADQSREIDDVAASNDPPITEELVQKSNEPEFQSAYEAKEAAQQDAAERPAAYREQEAAVLEGARQEAAANAAQQTRGMHAARTDQFADVVEAQAETQTADQARRAEVLRNIRAIYEDTREKVNERLDRLDGEVDRAFDAGAEDARRRFDTYVDDRMTAYKRRRYSGLTGGARWIRDKFLGLPDEVNAFYTEGRNLYIRLMDAVIDRIAGIVAAGLNEAMAIIAAGKQRIQDYVAGLPAALQEVGQQAAADIQADFDQLAQSVHDRQDRLIDSLAQRYNENLSAVDAAIEEMRAANRGLVDAAIDAVRGVIETIRELKNMLLGVLARAADVIGAILSDPIGFLGNLIAAVRQGLEQFVANIGTYLQEGLMGWLFGALGSAGIQMPDSFDLRGILSLVLQVLGLTYDNIRARAVAIVGEPVVNALEQGAEIFRILITQGPAGLWDFIKDRIADLKTTVIEGIKSFVIERIIMAGVTFVVSLFNPAGTFVKACKMIFDIVMFFIERGSQIMALVNAVLDSLGAIARGETGPAAAAVVTALRRALPVAISFLASLLGLGGISDKIREIIARV